MVWFLLWVYKSVPMCCKNGPWNKILIHKSALWRVAILQLTNRYVILPSKETRVSVRLDITKLVRVGPVVNRPSTDNLHHLVNKKTIDMWHMTRDKWHVTCDMWYVTCNTWHVTCCWGWTLSQKFSSYSLWFMTF